MSIEIELKAQIGKLVVLYLKGGGEIEEVEILKVTTGIDPVIETDVCLGRKGVFRINELAGFVECYRRKGVGCDQV